MDEMKSQFEEKMKSQLQKQQEKIDRFSSRDSTQEVFKSQNCFSAVTLLILLLLRDLSEGGIVGKIQPSGPKTQRYVLMNGMKEYLPDLVEQIIQDHIAPVLKSETQEEREKRLKEYIALKSKKIDGLTMGELSALRNGLCNLDPLVIIDISKELMKLI